MTPAQGSSMVFLMVFLGTVGVGLITWGVVSVMGWTAFVIIIIVALVVGLSAAYIDYITSERE